MYIWMLKQTLLNVLGIRKTWREILIIGQLMNLKNAPRGSSVSAIKSPKTGEESSQIPYKTSYNHLSHISMILHQ